jgi:HEAT repeat protein
MRQCAIEALTNLKDLRSIDLLINTLKDSDVEVRYSAATALGKFSDLRALSTLTLLAENDQSILYDGRKIRDSALEAIKLIQTRSNP